jgi:hypothetical protein
MATARQLEEDIQRSLEKLAQRVAELRDEKKPAEQIESVISKQETALEERILTERHDAIERAHKALKERAATQEQASREANNAADAKAYRPLDPETRDKMWNATNRSTEPRDVNTPEGRAAHRGMLEAAQKVIDAHADRLQDGLREATDALRDGLKPSFQFIREAQLQRENLNSKPAPGWERDFPMG